MIDRYTLPEVSEIWSDETRFSTWLEVELLATEAWARLGVVPEEDAVACRARKPIVDAAFVQRVAEREAITDHDVAAFVDVTQDAIGGTAGPWIHYGLTSSDVVDTALSVTLSKACDLLLGELDQLVEVLRRRAREFASTPMVGRTHGVHAEPTTLGSKLALWCLQVDRDRTRVARAKQTMGVGKLSGAVGTYSNINPIVEEDVCRALGLIPAPATQVIARDRHAEFVFACASVGATIELIATEIRHMQRTEVGEAFESFKKGQKGSSAMPHKRNPILSERLCGMARMLRGYVGPALEDVALWHERDISHSSVERVMLPDVSALSTYMTRKASSLIESLDVRTEQMLSNLDRSYGLVFSQSVLLALVESGLARDDAYRIVQSAAMATWSEQRPFREVLEENPEVSKRLKPEDIDAMFDLSRALANTELVIAQLNNVPGPGVGK